MVGLYLWLHLIWVIYILHILHTFTCTFTAFVPLGYLVIYLPFSILFTFVTFHIWVVAWLVPLDYSCLCRLVWLVVATLYIWFIWLVAVILVCCPLYTRAVYLFTFYFAPLAGYLWIWLCPVTHLYIHTDLAFGWLAGSHLLFAVGCGCTLLVAVTRLYLPLPLFAFALALDLLGCYIAWVVVPFAFLVAFGWVGCPLVGRCLYVDALVRHLVGYLSFWLPPPFICPWLPFGWLFGWVGWFSHLATHTYLLHWFTHLDTRWFTHCLYSTHGCTHLSVYLVVVHGCTVARLVYICTHIRLCHGCGLHLHLFRLYRHHCRAIYYPHIATTLHTYTYTLRTPVAVFTHARSPAVTRTLHFTLLPHCTFCWLHTVTRTHLYTRLRACRVRVHCRLHLRAVAAFASAATVPFCCCCCACVAV